MKTKCPKCGTGKARRICHREGGAEICSQCCASIRSSECGDCVHYEATWNHEARRAVSSGVPPNGEFVAGFDPEITIAVNDALGRAERGDTGKAMAALTDLLREHPRNHTVAFGIGGVHAMRGEHAESLEWFEKAIAIYPYSLESYYNKAVAHQKMMDIPNCIRSYQKVVAIGDSADPEVSAAREFLAGTAATINKHSGLSLALFLEAIDHFDRAFVLMEREKWQEALEGFQASAAINGTNSSCRGNIGLCHAYLGQKALALAEFDRALEIDPDYEPASGNRELVERMEEGIPLENVAFESINYGLEKFKKRG